MNYNQVHRITAFLCGMIIAVVALGAPSFTINAPAHTTVGSKFAVTFRLRDGEGTGLKVLCHTLTQTSSLERSDEPLYSASQLADWP